MSGQESMSVSFYNSLLGVGGDSSGQDEQYRPSQDADRRQVRMSEFPSDYGTVSRLIDETDERVGRTSEHENNMAGLTRRLAEMFEQKQELVSELKSERIKSEQIESERDDLQRRYDGLAADYDQALTQVEQTKAARERAAQFMEEAKEATRKVINESRMKVTDSEAARAEAERAYEDEHNLRRNLEQLLQEMKAENDAMSDRLIVMDGELKDANRAKDDTARRLAAAEVDLESLHAESEAHVSRIDHLTGRNELLARNLQSINMEHSELRKQFDATAVSHAALSADYEALVRRCNEAEEERDRLRIESLEHANFSAAEVESMRDELSHARNVIVLLRPIIQKAGAGELRKGDIRALDERLTDYEQSVSQMGGDADDILPQQMGATATQYGVQYEAQYAAQYGSSPYGGDPYQAQTQYDASYQSQQSDTYQTQQADAYQQAPQVSGLDVSMGTDMTATDGTGTGVSEVDAMTTADLYAALELDLESLGDEMTEGETGGETVETQVESVSFVDMFGQSQDGTGAVATDTSAGQSGDYDFDAFEDFDDLDEPDAFDDFEGGADVAGAGADGSDDEFDLSDPYADDEAGDGFTFPQDLKRSGSQGVPAGGTGAMATADSPDADVATPVASEDDFELDNLSDFNAIMANFAHYNEDAYEG